jgi:hypothetical protein
MNAPFTPVDSFAFANALVMIIADPAKHKARLDELKAQEKAVEEKIEMLDAMKAETPRLHSTAVATNIVADNRNKALDVREAEIEQRLEALARSEATKSDSALQRREIAVEARENAARAEAERLAATRKELDARLAKIKTFSSTL